jgi:uncharacterized protein (DUF2267 family)
MKTYKTYQARNAVKAAEVTNHIKARKKEGVSHERAKAEAYRLYKIKAALPILKEQFRISFAEAEELANQLPPVPKEIVIANYPPLPPLPKLPPLPQPSGRVVLPPLPTSN